MTMMKSGIDFSKHAVAVSPMTASVPYQSRVPDEFVGRARAFRSRVMAGETEFARAFGSIYNAVRHRLERKPTLRGPECLDLIRRWQNTDGFGQQHKATLFYSKRLVEFADYRLIADQGKYEDWEGNGIEPCVSLSALRLTMYRGRLRWSVESILSFSLHAMGRYYQRAFCPCDGALIDAMWGALPIAIEMVRADEGTDEYSLPAPGSGGQWFGQIVDSYRCAKPTEVHCSVDVRTFYVAEQAYG